VVISVGPARPFPPVLRHPAPGVTPAGHPLGDVLPFRYPAL